MSQHRQRRTARRPVSVAIVLALMLAIFSAGSMAAQAASSGSISGKVTKDGGAPLAGMCVTAYRNVVDPEAGPYWQDFKTVVTKKDGTFKLSGLAPKTYRIDYFDCIDNFYLYEAYDNAPSVEGATGIVVGAGKAVTGKNAELAISGAIEGKVTAHAGEPLSDIDVAVFEYGDDGEGNLGWNYLTDEYTEADGKYRIQGLPTGTYRVGFGDDYEDYFVAEFYDNATDVENATDLPVTAGATRTGVNAELAGPETPSPVSNSKAPKVTGSAKKGKSLSVNVGNWAPHTVEFAYLWLQNGTPIVGATKSTYKVVAVDVGKKLSVRVTGSSAGYTPLASTSAQTAVVK